MASGARGDRDQPVRTLVDGLASEQIVDHIVEHDAAVRMHRLVYVLARAQRLSGGVIYRNRKNARRPGVMSWAPPGCLAAGSLERNRRFGEQSRDDVAMIYL